MSNVHQRINNKATIMAWGNNMIRDWQKEMIRLKMVDTYYLINNIRLWGTFRGEHVSSMQIVFPLRGRFVDMGVGNGVKIGDVAELKIARRLEGKKTGNRRRPKKWLNKILAFSIHRLREIMAEKYGAQVPITIKDLK